MIESFSIKWKVYVNVYLSNSKVFRVCFSDRPVKDRIVSEDVKMLKRDMELYFKGEKIDFGCYDVILNVSDFVKSVLLYVRKIPYGELVTYGEIARELGTSPRAVGKALKLNPIPVIIPCHRVVAKNGLGGFSQGAWIKRELLKLENVEQNCGKYK